MFKNFVIYAIVVVLLSTSTTLAQTRYLEFRAGATASFPSNSSNPNNVTAKNIKSGIIVGCGVGYGIFEDMLRITAYSSYSAKGEKYQLSSGQQFNSDVNYFEIQSQAKFFIPATPIYTGVGLYTALATTRTVNNGDELVNETFHNNIPKYYKTPDYGAIVSAGLETSSGAIKYSIELSYECGLTNISARNIRTIKNRAIFLTAGITLEILNKKFKHY